MNEHQELDTRTDRRRRASQRIEWRVNQKLSFAETVGMMFMVLILGGIGVAITVLLHLIP